MDERMILDERDAERLWELHRPMLKEFHAVEAQLRPLSFGLLAIPKRDDLDAPFAVLMTHQRALLDRIEDIQKRAMAVTRAFVPEYPMRALSQA